MKNVMVTGAAGFLGSHLAMHHLRAGDRVYGVDDFCSSSTVSEHLKALCRHPNFHLSSTDICEPVNDWWRRPLAPKLQIIYNFACPASPPRYQSMPIKTMMTCVVGTRNVLNIAHLDGAVVVHASTSEVYGDPDRSPQREDYRGSVNSYGPRACYDEGKRAAEALCHDYRARSGVDARLVRIFNTYGPHMDPDDGRVVSNFICQALRGQRLTVYGTGDQTRSFCYVDDLIRGIVSMGELSVNPGVPINLGNPSEFTIKELAEMTGRLVMGDAFNNIECLKNASLPVDDPTQRCPDITQARNVLGWEPKITLETGLIPTVRYFRDLLT